MHISNRIHILRLITIAAFLIALVLPLNAEEKEDSVFMFRFPIGRNEFYSPGYNNGGELEKMYKCVDEYGDLIKECDGKIFVDGYSISKPTKKDNLALAKIRSNRVKSELITIKGFKEHNFITHNHATNGNYVTVRINIPKECIEARRENTEDKEIEPLQPEKADLLTTSETREIQDLPADTISSSAPEEELPLTSTPREDSNFALKTNLLDYAILMPNVEVEWMFAKKWSVALEGQMAWYSKTPPHKVYRVATVIPEVRFWPKKRSKWHGLYVGLFVGGGLYDLSKGHEHKGHEGEGMLGGISAGYMWPISKHLSLEAGIGAGYLRARDKVYLPVDGHYLYQLTKNINYFGPLRLKLSLVWRIPR